MAEMENIDDRLTQEVTLLLTKLVTAVAKQSELEESILQYHKDITSLRQANAKLIQYESWYSTMLPKHSKLQDELRSTRQARRLAEAQNSKLQAEVEDLTASLFSEANKMVNNALQETENFKVKNRKLYEELDEKDRIIDDLQEQLRDLKELFVRIDENEKTKTNGAITNEFTSNSSVNVIPASNYRQNQLHSVVFSPNINAVRLDLNNYNQDFKGFVYTIIKPEFTFDLANLLKLRHFKKIWTEELEHSIPTIPPLPAASIMNRWQRGTKFWHYIVEGRVSIEPVKGINEIYRSAYRKNTSGNTGSVYTSQAPVSIREPCSFCGETRDTVLEHSRLHYFKLLQGVAGDSDDDVVASYPLCNYCQIKMRTICDFFAKLRQVHTNVYRLEQDNSYEEFASTTTAFKRNSQIQPILPVQPALPVSAQPSGTDSSNASVISDKSLMNSDVQLIKIEQVEDSKLVKIYMTLSLIRSKIWWSKYGYWDAPENVSEANLDDIHYEAFSNMLGGGSSVKSTPVSTPVVQQTPSAPVDPKQPRTVEPRPAEPKESRSFESRERTVDSRDSRADDSRSINSRGDSRSIDSRSIDSRSTETRVEPRRSKVAEMISRVEAQNQSFEDEEDGGSIRSGESGGSRRRPRRITKSDLLDTKE